MTVGMRSRRFPPARFVDLDVAQRLGSVGVLKQGFDEFCLMCCEPRSQFFDGHAVYAGCAPVGFDALVGASEVLMAA